MKKLFFFLFTAFILAACNNNGGMGGGWSKAQENEFMQPCIQGGQTKEICACVLQKFEKKYPKYEDANTKGTAEEGAQWARECMNGNMGNGNDFNKNGGLGMGGGWSKSEENQFMQPCLQGGQSQEICSCVLQKLEKKYATFKEADQKGTSEEGKQLAMECMNGGNGLNNNDDNNNNNQEGSWTDQQRQSYIQGCSTAAQQQQGYSAQEANDYCDCMTRKIEQKYSFREANQLTATDLQTEEWQNAIANCRPRN